MTKRLRQTGHVLTAVCLFGLTIGSSVGFSAEGVKGADREEPNRALREEPGNRRADSVEGQRICPIIAQLDSQHFRVRNDASRKLAAEKRDVIPYLVDALGDGSREVRFRVKELLIHHYSFDDVIPHLINALQEPHGLTARTIIRDRALRQVDMVGETQHATKLFEFWGTDIETLRRRILFRLDEIKDGGQVAEVVEPLLGLQDKANRFHDGLSRLKSLSLRYDHQHSSGFIVARTLALGLKKNHSAQIDFAMRYLNAFETLAGELHSRDNSRSTIRKEISDRATMSDGATDYLTQFLVEDAPLRAVLAEQINISPEHLLDEFFRGLASIDSKECYCCVGKVHIVDMLIEIILEWPDAPDTGVVRELIVCTAGTVAPGDKNKALPYLDALQACKDLAEHGLDVREGLGEQLGQRLYAVALVAQNNRAYQPARTIHDRIMMLIDLKIVPGHKAFPQQLLEDYLHGATHATSERQRIALGRYLSVLEQLDKAGIGLDLELSGVERFVILMRDSLTTKHDLVGLGNTQLNRLLQAAKARNEKPDLTMLDRQLADWTDSR